MADFPMGMYQANHDGYDMQYYKPAAAAAFATHVPVVLNTGTGEIDECGADPALILGLVHSNADMAFLYDNRVPVARFTPQFIIGLAVESGLVATDVGKDYGITKAASGNWLLDRAKTGASGRFHVVRADVTNQIAICVPIATYIQSDGIAS
jgi:hypothetical protein